MTVFQGQKMRAARAKAQLTQQELADRVSVSRETVNRAENGQHVPEAEALARIAQVLGMTLDELFTEPEAVA